MIKCTHCEEYSADCQSEIIKHEIKCRMYYSNVCQFGTDEKIIRHDVGCFLFKYTCPDCKTVVDYQHYAGHFAACPERIIRCSYCGHKCSRVNMPEHRASCEKQKRNCAYCNTIVTNKDYEYHFLDCQEESAAQYDTFVKLLGKGFINGFIQKGIELLSQDKEYKGYRTDTENEQKAFDTYCVRRALAEKIDNN
ncbi:MAG: hypothetical protein Harvfovirus46_4 [Harvfovirus sp.]|uniref:TRAF-type domain-containing protein n=1 Tax=Harvfovirus sp. TaxID=2487768 RepID=A0A3G5A5U7_9VIRU|nr:MAG: hypothetical protein Harvfovirus46_4 [Harvfovirus sp.]